MGVSVSKENHWNCMGSLSGCLVDGDPAELVRANRLRRKAVALSIVAQGAALALLILVPLIWAGDRIALAGAPPDPIYIVNGGGHPPANKPRRLERPDRRRICSLCAPAAIHPLPSSPPAASRDDQDESPDIRFGDGPDIDGATPFTNGSGRTVIPPPPQGVRRVTRTFIQPAMIIRRVEPVYPALPRQLHRGGRVELRAIIATDGTIQSLQVISGDPLFYASALEAVRQWRYRPTILNGQAVEVDTAISVTYRLR